MPSKTEFFFLFVHLHVTLVELPQVFGYGRPEWCGADVRDLCREPK